MLWLHDISAKPGVLLRWFVNCYAWFVPWRMFWLFLPTFFAAVVLCFTTLEVLLFILNALTHSPKCERSIEHGCFIHILFSLRLNCSNITRIVIMVSLLSLELLCHPFGGSALVGVLWFRTILRTSCQRRFTDTLKTEVLQLWQAPLGRCVPSYEAIENYPSVILGGAGKVKVSPFNFHYVLCCFSSNSTTTSNLTFFVWIGHDFARFNVNFTLPTRCLSCDVWVCVCDPH